MWIVWPLIQSNGVLKHKRPCKYSKVSCAPPFALRRIEVILVDEASQIEEEVIAPDYESISEDDEDCGVEHAFQASSCVFDVYDVFETSLEITLVFP